MVDLLVALAQAVCVCGLIYGAYLSVRFYDADIRNTHKPREAPAAEQLRPASPHRKAGPAASSGDQHHVGA